MQEKLTRPEVARYLGVSPTRVAYSISKGWLTPHEVTFLGTEIFLKSDVDALAEARNIVVPGVRIAS